VASFAVIAAACSSPAAPAAPPAPTPAPTWTVADSDACATADLQLLNWDDDVGATAYALYYSDLGDVATARKQAGAAAVKYAALVKKMKVPVDVRDELATVESTLTAAATAFKGKETQAQFKATFGTIVDAFQAFDDGCTNIENWVTQNVPQ
jgi:hypothetical protein